MIEVVNIKEVNPKIKETIDIYIGRGSPLGNPFHVSMGRKQCIEAYEKAIMKCIMTKTDVREGITPLIYKNVANELNRIYKLHSLGKKVRLICYCKPQACHGDVVKSIIEETEKSRRKR